jgi:hypothetical protein
VYGDKETPISVPRQTITTDQRNGWLVGQTIFSDASPETHHLENTWQGGILYKTHHCKQGNGSGIARHNTQVIALCQTDAP